VFSLVSEKKGGGKRAALKKEERARRVFFSFFREIYLSFFVVISHRFKYTVCGKHEFH
jgi:hypothetical protein